MKKIDSRYIERVTALAVRVYRKYQINGDHFPSPIEIDADRGEVWEHATMHDWMKRNYRRTIKTWSETILEAI